MIKVLIVDDQDIMLQGLSMIVGKEDGLVVAGSCHNGQEAVDFCRNQEVDIVLMDIRMPVMNGVDATKIIIDEHENIKVIILTTFMDDEYIFSSLKNGASGYLLKDAKPGEITGAIDKVYHGGTLINPDVATKLVTAMRDNQSFDTEEMSHSGGTSDDVSLGGLAEHGLSLDLELTNREKDICHLLAEGRNNKEIGEILIISDGTVKNNITRILDKLDMRDRTQLALFALKHKI